jgi:hypothetical protein
MHCRQADYTPIGRSVAQREGPTSMIKFCIRTAAKCRRAAEAATDPSQRQTWLVMEGEWFYLARSYDNERREEGPDLK